MLWYNLAKYNLHKGNLCIYLDKISDIKLFQRDVQIQRNIAAPRYFPLMMLLCTEPEAKITKETENRQLNKLHMTLLHSTTTVEEEINGAHTSVQLNNRLQFAVT